MARRQTFAVPGTPPGGSARPQSQFGNMGRGVRRSAYPASVKTVFFGSFEDEAAGACSFIFIRAEKLSQRSRLLSRGVGRGRETRARRGEEDKRGLFSTWFFSLNSTR